MKRLILPIICLILGIGAGIGAGILLKPADPCIDDPAACQEADAAGADGADGAEGHGAAPPEGGDAGGHGGDTEADAHGEETAPEFVRLANQFIIPVVKKGEVTSLVVLSISLQLPAGQSAPVFGLEPRLRDSMLRVLFDHANSGGFDGDFTSTANLTRLRSALLEAARKTAGKVIKDVLILDLLRQDGRG